MLIAILVGVYFALGFAAAAMGFTLDQNRKIETIMRVIRLSRGEQAAYKAEILHHIEHLTVRPRPAERARLQRGD